MMAMVRLPLIVVACLILTGCIQRSIRIHSEPSGALVYLNDVEVGRTPTSVPFTFYGTYDVRLEKRGYQTLNTTQKASAPWYDNPGPDLATELLPWRTRVQLEWFFELEPLGPIDEALTIDRARQLRALLRAGEADPAAPTDAPSTSSEPTTTDAAPTDAPAGPAPTESPEESAPKQPR
jgi:hypothetical protein